MYPSKNPLIEHLRRQREQLHRQEREREREEGTETEVDESRYASLSTINVQHQPHHLPPTPPLFQSSSPPPPPPPRDQPPPSKHDQGCRRVIRNFTPSWFAVNMGTGIVSVLLHNLPWNARWLRMISIVIFALNVLLFVVFSLLTLLRYAIYPETWLLMIRHPRSSLFIGCFPMALTTIISMMIFSCSHWGHWLIYLAWALWWADALVSLAICVSIPFLVWTTHRPALQHTSAALLLPIVTCVVAASTGGVVAGALPSDAHALTTLVASYALLGIGESLSACVLALYFHRLTLHGLPSKDVIVSVFLPVGPLGQGGFAIQQLGRVALKVLPQTAVFRVAGVDPSLGAQFLYVLGVFLGLVMWGLALIWVCYALVCLAKTQRFPFNMGWWGFTFPLGVWGTCSSQLWQNLDSEFFKVVTMIISLSVVLLWAVVAFKTVRLTITGEIFVAPCLKDCQMEPDLEKSKRNV